MPPYLSLRGGCAHVISGSSSSSDLLVYSLQYLQSIVVDMQQSSFTVINLSSRNYLFYKNTKNNTFIKFLVMCVYLTPMPILSHPVIPPTPSFGW